MKADARAVCLVGMLAENLEQWDLKMVEQMAARMAEMKVLLKAERKAVRMAAD